MTSLLTWLDRMQSLIISFHAAQPSPFLQPGDFLQAPKMTNLYLLEIFYINELNFISINIGVVNRKDNSFPELNVSL